jgi:hypothetical protein
VDRVTEHVNSITGRAYRSGPRRNKSDARAVKGRARELWAGLNGESVDVKMGKVYRTLCIVVDEKWLQASEKNLQGRPRFDPDWVRPSTLYRPSNFDNYLAEAKDRIRKNRRFPWVSGKQPELSTTRDSASEKRS